MTATIDPPRPALRPRDMALIAATAVTVLLYLGVAERIAYRGRVMPGIKIGSLDPSGQREIAAYASIKELARRLETQPLQGTASHYQLTVDPAAVGLRVDTGATLRRARRAGRSGNPFEQVLGTLLRRIRPDHVAPAVTFDVHDVDATVDRWAAEVDRGLQEGELRFTGTTVTEISPHGGTGIDPVAAKVALVDELRSGDRKPLHLGYGPVAARTTAAQVTEVAREARAILAHGLRITSNGHTFNAAPAQIARSLTTRVDGAQLALAVDGARLDAALRPQLDAIGAAPVDASFQVTSDNRVVVVPSHDGLQPDVAVAAKAILANRTAVDVPLARRHPARDTAWAQRLGITHQVSSFTTYYVPGQARVTNIHRAVDIMNNAVVEPGKVFSLNGTVGARTPERGFVKAPVYYDGETEDFGGGVSQVATTTYNAVFWGGYEVVEHQPHTIYYPRYPLGRDATVNYPILDLKWRDNTHHGVLVRATYTSSSITVTFYGDNDGKSVREESTRCASSIPTQRCIDIVKTTPFTTTPIRCPVKEPKLDPTNECARLKPDERFDTFEGHTGYDVTYFRVIDQPGQKEIRERHSWHYDMLPDVIFVGAKPKGTTTTIKGHGPTTTIP
jgi:vancomycin resistance protein YoaR